MLPGAAPVRAGVACAARIPPGPGRETPRGCAAGGGGVASRPPPGEVQQGSASPPPPPLLGAEPALGATALPRD